MIFDYLNKFREPLSSIPQPQPRGFFAVAQDCRATIDIKIKKKK